MHNFTQNLHNFETLIILVNLFFNYFFLFTAGMAAQQMYSLPGQLGQIPNPLVPWLEFS